MSTTVPNTHTEALTQMLESARQLGVELNEAEALQWLAAIAAWKADDDPVTVDHDADVFGHAVTLLDFKPDDLAYFRQVGRLVEFEERPGIETALALSGSAAQSKIQTYPGDCDYFERINIKATTRHEACQMLATLIREKALATRSGPTYRLIEVKFGSYPTDVVHDGEFDAALLAVRRHAGSPITWTPADIDAGCIGAFSPAGEPVTIQWEQAAAEPGWCKLDWVVADPVRKRVANASNMIDATWEAPDGSITPLDGYLDPYFQEIYLDADSIPLFSKLVQHISTKALDEYVVQLEREVAKYVGADPKNYGKAAKRMYNIFRLNGRYPEAAFLREMFDEPTTVLYQVWSLMRTLDEAARPDSAITRDTLLAQADELIMSVLRALDGDSEADIVRALLHLRDSISRQADTHTRPDDLEAARAEVIHLVNAFFYERLVAVPAIRAYMEQFTVVETNLDECA